MLTLKKQGNCYTLPLQLYVDGIKKVKLRLLELHPEYECMIKAVSLKFLVKLKLSQREEKSLIVESAPKNSLMTLNDKSMFTNPIFLIMKWLKILGAVLTLKEKDCKEFWNNQCAENSKKLWFPTEIDCVDLHLSLLNGSLPKTIQNSWFSIKQSINPQAKNSQKTFSPLFKSSHVEKWEKEGIRALRIKLLPTKKQKQTLEKWAGTTRYVYNKCLEKVKLNPKLNTSKGYKQLCKECITEKDNNVLFKKEEENLDKFIYNWELETPKDIRKGALRDIEKAYKTAWANLKAGNITSFGLNTRTKKNGNEQSMEIASSAIKVIKKNNKILGFKIYSSKKYMPDIIKIDHRSLKGFKIDDINRYARLKKENNEWYLCISYDVDGIEQRNKNKTCAIDPGIRKFVVIYSEDKVIQIIPNQDKIEKILKTLDTFQSLRDNKKIRQQTYTRKRCKLQKKLQNLVGEMQFKTINFLTKNYSNILLPSFETQEMVGNKKLHRSTKRKMLNFSFYKFKQRLIHKASLLQHCNVEIVNEAYTSQTCGYCGNLKKTSAETIKCDKCFKVFDRDINGARNIYLKYLK